MEELDDDDEDGFCCKGRRKDRGRRRCLVMLGFLGGASLGAVEEELLCGVCQLPFVLSNDYLALINCNSSNQLYTI